MIVFVGPTKEHGIETSLRKAGLTVWTIESQPDFPQDQMLLNGLQLVDAMILDIAYSHPDMHYLLAQAIILQKQTLCIYPKSQVPRAVLNHLSNPNVPKVISAKAFSPSSLIPMVHKFVGSISDVSLTHEIPNIKFTLRLTQSLDGYLLWLAKQRNVNKAEFIRQLIAKAMSEDGEFQNDTKKLDKIL